MWAANGDKISMVEGEYGISLPLTITGITIASGDTITFTVRKARDTEVLLEKPFTNVQSGTISLVLTETESENLPVGKYQYVIDWWQEASFEANLVHKGSFEVVAKWK